MCRKLWSLILPFTQKIGCGNWTKFLEQEAGMGTNLPSKVGWLPEGRGGRKEMLKLWIDWHNLFYNPPRLTVTLHLPFRTITETQSELTINPLHPNNSIHILYLLFSIHISWGAHMANLTKNQGTLKMVIISSILVTSLHDSEVIL